MKKLYKSPDVLLAVLDPADIITGSTLNYSNADNAEINQDDVHVFGDFF